VRQPAQQPALVVDRQLRAAELADLGALNPAAQVEHHGLHPVADAQHRDPELEQFLTQRRRPVGVDGSRATRQDQAPWLPPSYVVNGNVVRQQLREHSALAHATRNELRVLPPEIKDQHFLVARLRDRRSLRLGRGGIRRRQGLHLVRGYDFGNAVAV